MRAMRPATNLSCALLALFLIACSSKSETEAAGGGAGNASTARPETPEDAAALAPPSSLAFPDVEGWTRGQPESSMRAAEYVLPAVEGDTKDATLVVYYFVGGAGGWDANVARWCGQFQQPDGSPSSEVAVHSEANVAGRKTPQVEVTGRYVAAAMPGQAERFDEPGWKMIATYLDGADGAWFFKLVGPEKTVDANQAAFRRFLADITAS
jgi:hypothetical protein